MAGQSGTDGSTSRNKPSMKIKDYEHRIRESTAQMLLSMEKIAELGRIAVGSEHGQVPKFV